MLKVEQEGQMGLLEPIVSKFSLHFYNFKTNRFSLLLGSCHFVIFLALGGGGGGGGVVKLGFLFIKVISSPFTICNERI